MQTTKEKERTKKRINLLNEQVTTTNKGIIKNNPYQKSMVMLVSKPFMGSDEEFPEGLHIIQDVSIPEKELGSKENLKSFYKKVHTEVLTELVQEFCSEYSYSCENTHSWEHLLEDPLACTISINPTTFSTMAHSPYYELLLNLKTKPYLRKTWEDHQEDTHNIKVFQKDMFGVFFNDSCYSIINEKVCVHVDIIVTSENLSFSNTEHVHTTGGISEIIELNGWDSEPFYYVHLGAVEHLYWDDDLEESTYKLKPRTPADWEYSRMIAKEESLLGTPPVPSSALKSMDYFRNHYKTKINAFWSEIDKEFLKLSKEYTSRGRR